MPTEPPAPAKTSPPLKPVLTARQVEVFQGLAAGKSFKVIAHEAGVTHGAVRARFLAARQRLGARNMVHAVVLALSRGLIVGPDGEEGNEGR